jgi:hypothetical protein
MIEPSESNPLKYSFPAILLCDTDTFLFAPSTLTLVFFLYPLESKLLEGRNNCTYIITYNYPYIIIIYRIFS